MKPAELAKNADNIKSENQMHFWSAKQSNGGYDLETDRVRFKLKFPVTEISYFHYSVSEVPHIKVTFFLEDNDGSTIIEQEAVSKELRNEREIEMGEKIDTKEKVMIKEPD